MPTTPGCSLIFTKRRLHAGKLESLLVAKIFPVLLKLFPQLNKKKWRSISERISIIHHSTISVMVSKHQIDDFLNHRLLDLSTKTVLPVLNPAHRDLVLAALDQSTRPIRPIEKGHLQVHCPRHIDHQLLLLLRSKLTNLPQHLKHNKICTKKLLHHRLLLLHNRKVILLPQFLLHHHRPHHQ